ncbi:MAG: threonylcarbamoyl-AMP synthase [Treponema sp.]|jgi:L-threonylcarbamoyladenylate synthase|nr:threonylcarbamoyl-AMP synthase [Treponema sp.]
MKYLPVTVESIEQAAVILRGGGIVAFPTETVYGLGADAFNAQAIAKIFEVKGRPHFDPLIIHIAATEALENVANLSLLSEEARKKLFLLAENLMPGPLSIILPKNEKIPAIASAGLPTAAIRFPSHPAAIKLISLCGGALAAPSANPFGSLSPTRAEHVRDKLGDKIDMILDGGQTQIGLESTVLDITGQRVKILRPGGTTKEAIEKLIGNVDDGFLSAKTDAPLSPGQLKSHYAPLKPLSALSRQDILRQSYEKDSAFLFFDSGTRDEWISSQKPPKTAVFRVLSESGQALTAAGRLFEILHELENCSILRIFAQFAPAEGLGEAINDRLRRGSVLS